MAQVTLQKQRLSAMTQEENLAREIAQEGQSLSNQTIGELIRDMANEFVNIVQELLELPKSLSPRLPLAIVAVFTKGNRLIYIGILLSFAGMFSMFANR